MEIIKVRRYETTPDRDLAWAIAHLDDRYDVWQAVEDARSNRRRGWQTPRYDALPSVEVL